MTCLNYFRLKMNGKMLAIDCGLDWVYELSDYTKRNSGLRKLQLLEYWLTFQKKLKMRKFINWKLRLQSIKINVWMRSENRYEYQGLFRWLHSLRMVYPFQQLAEKWVFREALIIWSLTQRLKLCLSTKKLSE